MNIPADLNLYNESDVEQKFIYPLLTSNVPAGLGYTSYDFRTKADIRKIKIDKGTKGSIYYPDYLIILQGLPLLVIEAKTVGEDLEAAWKEARLYATEINKEYPHGFNPCQKVIITNGQQTIASFWDTDTEKIEVSINDLNISNEQFYSFINFCKKETLLNYVTKLQKKVRKETKFIKPTSLLGGKSFQGSTITPNSFGENLSIEYKYLFNPDSEEERAEIAKNAYVSTKKKLAHVRPIDRLIRATLPPSFIEAKTISDSIEPKEIFTILKDQKKLVVKYY